MIKFIEECVARMNDGTQLTADKQELITKLNEKRNEAEIALKVRNILILFFSLANRA